MTKRCVKCDTVKETANFTAYKRNRDGLNSWCKPCNLEASRAYKRRNREIVNAKALVAVTAHYWANREKVLARVRERRALDPTPHRESSKKWARNNSAKIAEYGARRRAQMGAPIGYVDREYIIQRDAFRCHICGDIAERHEIHLDHLIPLSKGGGHTVENVRVSHAHCNQRRGAGRTPAQLLLFG